MTKGWRWAQWSYVLRLGLVIYVVGHGLYWTATGLHSPGGPSGAIPLVAGLLYGRRMRAITGMRALADAYRQSRSSKEPAA